MIVNQFTVWDNISGPSQLRDFDAFFAQTQFNNALERNILRE